MRKDIIIPAAINGTPGVYTENISEAGLSIVSATAALQVFVGTAPAQTLASGMSLGAESGPALGLVTFQNISSTDIDVTIGDYSLARPTTIQANAETFAFGEGWFDFGSASGLGGGKVTFTGTTIDGQIRKSLTITNYGITTPGGATSTALIVGFLGGQTTIPSFAVFPGMTETFEFSDDVILWSLNANLSGQPTHLTGSVLPVFYTKPLQTDQ